MTRPVRILFLFLIACTHSFAQKTAPKKYTISGFIKGVPDGKQIMLTVLSNLSVDSTIFKNGRFVFNGVTEEPVEAAIIIDPNNDKNAKPAMFWFEAGLTTLKGNADSLDNLAVTGSALNKDLRAFNQEVAPMGEFPSKGPAADSVTARLIGRFITKYPASYMSAQELFLFRAAIPMDTVRLLYARLTDKMQASSYGKLVALYIKDYHPLKDNDQAPDFTMTSVDGRQVSLSSYKGKKVLLVFWASGCGPCRAENPQLNALYAKYKSAGFEILGVGLEPKKDLLQAIHKDSVKFTNVYDDKSWFAKAAILYGVQSIPKTFFIDGTGRILVCNIQFLNAGKDIIYYEFDKGVMAKFDDLLK